MVERRRTRVPLNTFATFEVLARHLNMGRAGAEMGVTAAAVSHQIAKLEEFVGCELFAREGRRLALTSRGQRLAGDLGRAFALIDDGISDLGQAAQSTEPVTIVASFSLCSFWLPALTRAYRRLHPEAEFRIASQQRMQDFDQADADITIADRLPDNGRDGVPLFDARLLPVCTPSLLEEYPGGTVASLPLIWIDYSQADVRNAPITWDAYFREHGIDRAFNKHGISVHPSFATHAALAGLGAQLAREPVVEHLLGRGDLVQVGPPSGQRHQYFLWSRPPDQARPAVAAFREWLLAGRRALD